MQPLSRLHAEHFGALVIALAAGLSGCASSSSGGLLDKTLSLVGLGKPEVPAEVAEAAAAAKPKNNQVSLRIHAGEQLNTDPQKRSLSVVVRIYKLRSASAFLAAPYKAFGTADGEKAAFGNDLLDVRELVLTPGQRHEVVETLSTETSHLAVAALFRAPADGRWRFAFRAKDSVQSGVTLGVHGCALSVAAGSAEDAAPETLRLAGVNCK